MAPSVCSVFSVVSMSWFIFVIVLCCGPLTCLLLATPLHTTIGPNSGTVPAIQAGMVGTCTSTIGCSDN